MKRDKTQAPPEARIRHPRPRPDAVKTLSAFAGITLFAALALSPIALSQTAAAANGNDPEKPEAQPENPNTKVIHPRLLEALEEFIATLRRAHDARASQVLEDSFETLSLLFEKKLTPEAMGDFSATLPKALKEASEQWQQNARDSVTRLYAGKDYPEPVVDELIRSLHQAIKNPGQIPKNFRITPDISPTATAIWEAQLDKHLNDQQLASLKAPRKLLTEYYKDLSRQSASRYRHHLSQKIEQTSAEIQAAIALGEERSQQIAETVTFLIDQAVENLAAEHLKTLMKKSPKERRYLLRRGYVGNGSVQVTDPSESKVWSETLSRILSPEEQATWKHSAKLRRQSALETGARLLTTALDDMLLLSEKQRQNMTEILMEPSEKHLFRTLTEPNYSLSMTTSEVTRYAESVSRQHFRTILLDWQYSLWDKHLDRSLKGANAFDHLPDKHGNPPGGKTRSTKQSIPPPWGAEELLEATLSSHILEAAESFKAEAEKRYEGRLHSTATITNLDEAGWATLEVAARGATELERSDWVLRFDEHVRKNLQDTVDPASISQRINEMRDSRLRRTADTSSAKLWNSTLQAVLTAPQLAAMQKDEEDRRRFRFETLGLVNAHLLSARTRLSLQQVHTLAARIAEEMDRYAPDLAATFQGWNKTPWYLNSYYTLIGLHMVEEAQLKAIVHEEAYLAWVTKLQSLGRGYWKVVQGHHENRLLQEKKNAR